MKRILATAGALAFVFALAGWAGRAQSQTTQPQTGQTTTGTTDTGAWDASQIRTLRGQIVSIDRQGAEGERIGVRIEDGTQADVTLAPEWFLQNQRDFTLAEGDTVEIRAYPTSGRAYQAASVTKGGQTLRLRDALGNPYWGSMEGDAAARQQEAESRYSYMAGCTPQQRGDAQRGWARQGGYGQLFNPNTVQTFTGTVAAIGTFNIADEMSQLRQSQIGQAEQAGQAQQGEQQARQGETGQQGEQGREEEAGRAQAGQQGQAQQGSMGQGGMGMMSRMMGNGMDVTLETTDRGRLDVHLGPSWFMDNVGLDLKEGDPVTVEGSLVTLNGRPVVLASQVTKGDQVVNLRDATGNPCWMASRRASR